MSNKLLKGIASAGGVNYISLANDYSDVNYSSARVSMQEVRDDWRIKQQWFIGWFHDVIFGEWLRMAISTGQIPLSLSRMSAYLQVRWTPRSWAWVDPQKEQSANLTALSMRTTSLTRICEDQGSEIEEVMEELAKEQALAKSLNIDMSVVFGSKTEPKKQDAMNSLIGTYHRNGKTHVNA